MKTRNLYLLLSLLLFVNCNKENETILEDPVVSTNEVQEIYSYSVLVTGEFTKLGDYNIIDHGFVLAKHSEPTLDDSKISLGSINNLGEFQSLIENLEPNTEYFVRSYLEYEVNNMLYGNTLSFKTLETNVWMEKSRFQGGYRSGAVSFTVNDKLFIGTGIQNLQMNDFYEYNYQNDTWKSISSLPDERAYAISFSVGNYGYVGLGEDLYSQNYLNDIWRYDPQNNNWTKMSNFPGTPRSYSTCFVIGDKAYVTGGSSVDDNDLWEYSTNTDTWIKKADYPGGCSNRGISFSINNKGYVGFGWKDGTCNDFWEYDPVTDIWTEKGNFPGKPRYSAVGFSYMNTGFIACGVNQDYATKEYLTDLWEYKQENDTWTKINTSFPGNGRIHMIVGVIDNKIILGLGTNSITGGSDNRFDDMWEYIPEHK